MNNLKLFLFLSLLFLHSIQADTNAQEMAITYSDSETIKIRLPHFPLYKISNFHSLDDEVAYIIHDAVNQSGLYEITVGIQADTISEINDSATVVEPMFDIEEFDGSQEIIVISATHMEQAGIPDDDATYFTAKHPIFKKHLKKSADVYSSNIRTVLEVHAYFISTETAEYLGPFNFEVTHTGGSYNKSRSKALDIFREKVMRELKRIFWLAAEIESTEEGIITLPLGTDSGIDEGMIFEIVEPDRKWTKDTEEVMTESGGTVGFASVVNTDTIDSELKIIRQWKNHYAGSWVVIYPKTVGALQLHYIPPSTDSYIGFGLCYYGRPLQAFDWGMGMQIIQVTDSFNKNDFGFGFFGSGIWRFLYRIKFDLGCKLGLDLDIPFKKDDADQQVNTALLSAHLSIIAEFPISAKSDLVIAAGYRFGVKSDKWDYTEEDETYPAYWEYEPPEVDNTGIMLSIGYKYLLYY